MKDKDMKETNQTGIEKGSVTNNVVMINKVDRL